MYKLPTVRILGVNCLKKKCVIMGTKNVIGAKVEILRKQKGLTQKDLAKVMVKKGVSISSTGLSKIESQNRMVSDIELVALSEIFEVSVDDLIG